MMDQKKISGRVNESPQVSPMLSFACGRWEIFGLIGPDDAGLDVMVNDRRRPGEPGGSRPCRPRPLAIHQRPPAAAFTLLIAPKLGTDGA